MFMFVCSSVYVSACTLVCRVRACKDETVRVCACNCVFVFVSCGFVGV